MCLGICIGYSFSGMFTLSITMLFISSARACMRIFHNALTDHDKCVHIEKFICVVCAALLISRDASGRSRTEVLAATSNLYNLFSRNSAHKKIVLS